MKGKIKVAALELHLTVISNKIANFGEEYKRINENRKVMDKTLEKKVEQAIKLIRSAAGGDVVEVAYSGGKDSDVILELVKMSGVKYRAIYKNTTIDPPGTLKHCKDKGVEIHEPKNNFFELIAKYGLPNRANRMCCSRLKEYKILDKCVQGIRRCESTKRAKRYSVNDPIVCRFYGSKKNHVNVILPILSWTDREEAQFIKERNIQCHPLYYDDKGRFHPERRLGCFGCPLRSDNGTGEYLRNPKYLRPLVRAVKKFWETHPHGKMRKYIDPYGHICRNLFFNADHDFFYFVSKDFEDTKVDFKKILEDYFKIKLP